MGNKGFIKLTSNPRGGKSGYDQAFTLQKGVSAAPIKQVKTKNNLGNFIKKHDDTILEWGVGGSVIWGPAVAITLASKSSSKKVKKNKTLKSNKKVNPRIKILSNN